MPNFTVRVFAATALGAFFGVFLARQCAHYYKDRITEKQKVEEEIERMEYEGGPATASQVAEEKYEGVGV